MLAKLVSGEHDILALSRNAPSMAAPVSVGAVRWLRGDLRNLEDWQGELAAFGPEAALHLAWEGIPNFDVQTSLRNVAAGVALLECLGRAGCKTIIASGTCAEYGSASGRVSEAAAAQPQDNLGMSKHMLHWWGRELLRVYPVRFIWARLFYVYGPGQRSASLIPSLLSARSAGVMPELKNPPGAHDFVYVGDAVRALASLLAECERLRHHVYNIGSGRLTTVGHIYDLMFSGAPSSSAAVSAGGFYADISRMSEDTGWHPEIPIAAGIALMKEQFHSPSFVS